MFVLYLILGIVGYGYGIEKLYMMFAYDSKCGNEMEGKNTYYEITNPWDPYSCDLMNELLQVNDQYVNSMTFQNYTDGKYVAVFCGDDACYRNCFDKVTLKLNECQEGNYTFHVIPDPGTPYYDFYTTMCACEYDVYPGDNPSHKINQKK